MKEAKKTQITEMICKQAQLMRKGGANQTEIAELLGVNACTISRIEKAGFDLATYQATRRLEKQMEKEKKTPKVVLEIKSEDLTATDEQVPGQLRMEIPEKIEGAPINATYADEIGREYPERVKLMRFQAHQADRIVKAVEENAVMLNTKLDKLNDTLSMILRAIRKE